MTKTAADFIVDFAPKHIHVIPCIHCPFQAKENKSSHIRKELPQIFEISALLSEHKSRVIFIIISSKSTFTSDVGVGGWARGS